jgi:hypothetical protein
LKLSDIQGERTLDVIADLIDPVANIAQDPNTAAIFRREKVPQGADVKAYAIKRLRTHLPALLHGHKQDIIAILASIKGVPTGEFEAGMNLKTLMEDLIDLVSDDVFMAFFRSAPSKPDQEPAGAASESTGDPAE